MSNIKAAKVLALQEACLLSLLDGMFFCTSGRVVCNLKDARSTADCRYVRIRREGKSLRLAIAVMAW